jgi:ArsR family transcriptional regulator
MLRLPNRRNGDTRTMDALLQALKAAAEPTRLRLLALCAHAELTVTELTQILGQSQPRVSRHLKLLCDAGLLERHREGTWAFYRLAGSSANAELSKSLADLIAEDDDIVVRDLERLEIIKRNRAQAAADYFGRNAERWHEIRSLYVDESEVEAAVLRVIGERPVRDFLDIGTGTGRMLEIMAPRVERGIGIDLSHDMLRVARAHLERADYRHCQVRHGDMYNLQVPTGEFDLVIIHQVLHYAEKPAAVIGEAARALRPGGLLVIVDFAPHEEQFLRDEHQHRWLGFEETQVAGWCLGAGLEAHAAIRLRGNPLTIMIWPAQRPVGAATRVHSNQETAQ